MKIVETFIKAIFIALLIVIFILHGTMIAVYNLPPKDKDVIESINKYKEGGVLLNEINEDIFRIGNMPNYISKTPIYSLFPYYINNVGVIPFWYKSNKMLKEMHKIEKAKLYKSKRTNLGL